MKKKDYLNLMQQTIARGPYTDSWASLCKYPEPEWYKNAKFGIFIHWGPYSVPAFANEWYSRNMYIKGSPEFEHHVKTYGAQKDFGYKDFIPMFRGEKFDAKKWLKLIKASGAEYVLPVAEHHDGFQMYDSDLSIFNAKKMGPKRDILNELKKATEKEGLIFALSNHRAEHCWFFNGGLEYDSDVTDPANEPFYGKQQPGGGSDAHDLYACPPTPEHCEDWLSRLVELVEKYKPSIVYFDWWIHNTGFKPYLKKFLAYYYNWATELGLNAAVNYKHHAIPPGAAILDVERGGLDNIHPRIWQTCTATARNSWGYTETNDYKTAEEIISELIDVVSKNGRMLLNIGPKADGTITPEEEKILKAIGEWLKINGEGIHGTSCWEKFGEPGVRYTTKDGAIYAFILNPPPDGKIELKSLKRNNPKNYSGGDFDILKIELLGSSTSLGVKRTCKSLSVTINPLPGSCPICLKITVD